MSPGRTLDGVHWARALALTMIPTLVACASPMSSSIPSVSDSAALNPHATLSPTVPGVSRPAHPPDDFYQPRTTMVAAAQPGSIIDVLELSAAQPGISAYAVLYGSTGLDGEPVAVSGLVIVPDRDPPPGGFPIVASAHGTTGSADECAPSRQGVTGDPAAVALAQQGYVVAATDYEGLGLPGPFPYLVGLSAGRSVLDAIRAAAAIVPTAAGGRAVILGHSEGGHAALWAAELAPSYASEIEVLGAWAASPVIDLPGIVRSTVERSAQGDTQAAGALLRMFGAYSTTFDLPLDYLTAEGREIARLENSSCDTLAPDTSPYLSDPAEVPAWRTVLMKNSPGAERTDVPMVVVAARDDELVPYATQRLGVAAMCALGDIVELRTVEGDHGASFWTEAAFREMSSWVADRVAGRASGSTC